MKKTVIILLIFNCLTGYSQINDDFSDANFSSNPEWNGSNAGGDFRIINNRLRSESTKASGNFYLSTSNTYAKNCYWEFWVNLQFSTSGSNYVDIYLVSDQSDLQSTLINGYFVRIGNTEDEISLYRRSGPAVGSTRIIDGINGSVGSNNNTIKVRVSRDNLGLFSLEREVIGTNSQLVNEGTFLDNSHVNTSSFGIFIQQSTASFFQKHFFDDFKIGILKIDTIAPTLSTVTVLNSTTLELQFSEAMDSLSVKDKKNYTIQNFNGIILDINTETNPQKYTIRLSEPLSTGNFILTVINVLDRSGNKIKSNSNHSFNYTKPYYGIFRDIVINELFPDPSPQVGLPMAEFVELLNTSDKTISIKDWKILDLTSTAIIGDFSISPGSSLILCAKTDTLEFQKFGKVIGISPWPSLNNSNDVIKLLNTQNSLIDSVSYSDLWYRNAEKKQGGWSLERIDPRSVCEGSFNWAASIDSIGGTPGKRNSVQKLNYDLLLLKADSVNKTTDTTLIVYFNKHIDKSTILKENFRLSPEAGDIRNIIPDAENKQVKITFNKIFTAGITYSLIISGLKDCSGNSIQNQSAGFSFSIPAPAPPPLEKPDTALIYISEIFADPSPEVGLPLVEFVEIHNPGKDPVNLEGWSLSDTQTKSTLKKNLIAAGEFLILCPAADTSLYKPFGKTLGLSPWPSLGNASDRLVLKSIKNRTVDSIAYSDTWYNDPKKRQGGWSLERIDVLSKCSGIFNWTSSIDTVGGTPGKKNSVNIQNYDLIPFKTDSLILKSDSTLFLFFNKSADSSTLKVENFLLLPSAGQIKNITQDSKCRQITITFSEKFTGGKTYNLKLSGLKDCSGNSIHNQSAGFSFSIPAPAPPPLEKPDTALIYISEIFADPSPEVGLPLVEFVEIHNPGKDPVNLEGWSLSDTQTKSTLKKNLIAAGEFLILCPAADTSLYKPFGKTLGLSPWPSLGNASDRLVLKSIKNRTVDSIAYSDTWYNDPKKRQGGWSLERIDVLSKCSGIFNWTSSIDTVGGTPGKKNSVNIQNYDLIPFKTDSLILKSDSTLFLFFNKSADSSTLKVENFLLLPSAGQIKNITQDSKCRQITITFSEKFTGGKTYNLKLSGLKDCSGNSIHNQSAGFSFSIPAPAPPPLEKPDTALIYISEIFADPSPEVGLPLVEFVEIHNPGKDPVNLEGWSLSDTQTKSTLKKNLIAAGEFLILCPAADTSLYKPFGKTLGLSPWPSLGNASDRLVLESIKNRTVDSIAYSDTWYKDNIKKSGGWSLEKIILNQILCPDFYNWAASTDKTGGTPGRKNSINNPGTMDTESRIVSITVLSDSTVYISFNQIPDTNYLKASNFNIPKEIGGAKTLKPNADFLGITLSFSQKFKERTDYLLIADSLYSCSGKLSSDINKQITFNIPSIPENQYPLIINEIFADPAPSIGLPDSEFVELYNPTSSSVSLAGLNFGDQTRNFSLTKGEITARSYLILCAEKDTSLFSSYGKVIGIPLWPDLNNENDILILKNNKGKEIHKVRYSSNWYRDSEKRKGGYTLELIDPESICIGSQNWKASIDSSGGTPGRMNSLYQNNYNSDVLKLIEIEVLDSLKILLTFNNTVDSLKASSNSNYFLNNGVGNPIKNQISEPDFNQIALTFREPFSKGQTYRLTTNNISDCKNRTIPDEFNSLEFTISRNIGKNDIILTEILFNPRAGGADFIEILNNSDHELDLKDLYIGRIIKDSINSIRQLSKKQLFIEPDNYIALTPDPENIKKEYFIKDIASILKLDPFPQFNDDAGTAVLISNGQLIDVLSYTEKMHFQLLKTKEGVSLERSKLNRPNNEPGNLRSATSASGFATPGYKNSQNSDNPVYQENITLSSKTFSPDNDGFEDLLEINYQFSEPGKIANISIFNVHGILIKRLLKNYTLNIEGSFVWDGFNEQSQLVPGGIYLLQANIFDKDGRISKFTKSFVLAVKL